MAIPGQRPPQKRPGKRVLQHRQRLGRAGGGLQGLGIGYGPYWQIRHHLDRGALKVIMEDFEGPRMPVHAVFPPSGMPPAKTRLFADLLAERLKRERL